MPEEISVRQTGELSTKNVRGVCEESPSDEDLHTWTNNNKTPL